MEAQPPAFPFVMGKIIEFVNDCHRRWVQKKKKKKNIYYDEGRGL